MKTFYIALQLILHLHYLSQHTIFTIKKYETLQLTAYQLGDYKFIGYGHLNYENFVHISQSQADSLLIADLIKNYNYIPDTIAIQRRFYLAVLSYNIGINKIRQSEIYKNANQLSTVDFIKKYHNYCYYNGKKHILLEKRRIEEIACLEKSKNPALL